MEKGYIQVYTGNGKGKTTAALGVALRSLGNGFRIAIAQFVKSPDFKYNEMKALEFISGTDECEGEILVEQFGTGCCIHGTPTQADFDGARRGLEKAKEWINGEEWDLVILDEINIALWLNLISVEEVLDILRNKPDNVEVILTGRHAVQEIIDIADLVTEMKEIKHYYRKGILARPGIEK